MPQVVCPFCGQPVSVFDGGSIEPTCRRCGAWVMAARPAAAVSAAVDRLSSTMALETRDVSGPGGDLTFVASPYLPGTDPRA